MYKFFFYETPVYMRLDPPTAIINIVHFFATDLKWNAAIDFLKVVEYDRRDSSSNLSFANIMHKGDHAWNIRATKDTYNFQNISPLSSFYGPTATDSRVQAWLNNISSRSELAIHNKNLARIIEISNDRSYSLCMVSHGKT